MRELWRHGLSLLTAAAALIGEAGPLASAGQETRRRDADDRRHRLERLRLLWWRCELRSANSER
jgi:hypothetical protein